MATYDDYTSFDATDLAELVRRKEVKPVELVESAIDSIERLNPLINAVVTPMYELALKAASGPLGGAPFAGVPFLLKDVLAEYAGVRFTEGTAFLRDYVSEEDSELVARYKRAGLLIVGKTNTPELAIGVTTEPRLFGPTRNPWDTTRTPGGSSGGSAAAVATRMTPMAHGNDAGGSIRVPASCCGVFGLKPTRGRNPLGPHYGDLCSGLVAEHALTRSVRDSAALLDATAGPEIGAPYSISPPTRPFLQEVGTEPGQLRIAFASQTPLGTVLHPDCSAALREAVSLCDSCGHEMVEKSPDLNWELLWQTFTTVLATGFAWAVADWGRRTGRRPVEEHFEPFVWAFTERGRQLTGTDYLLAVQDLQQCARDVAHFFVDYDLWLTPTLGEPPVPLGSFSFSDGDPFALRRRMAAFTPFTYLSNVTGQPAMSVPLYWNTEGVPIGTHFVGRYGDEATLFRLAGQLEMARPWANWQPPFISS